MERNLGVARRATKMKWAAHLGPPSEERMARLDLRYLEGSPFMTQAWEHMDSYAFLGSGKLIISNRGQAFSGNMCCALKRKQVLGDLHWSDTTILRVLLRGSS